MKYAFVDMDGVLADFVGAAEAAHGRKGTYTAPANLGRFEIEDLWGITAEEFWKPIDRYEFWVNLNETPEARFIINSVVGLFGIKNVCVLTSPSNSPDCIPAKKQWMREHFPMLEKQMLFGGQKQFLAGPDRLLIDDRTKNIRDFESAGGVAITVPRPWNDLHKKSAFSAVHINQELRKLWSWNQ